MKDLHEMSSRARSAFYTVSVASHEKRNEALSALAGLLSAEKEQVFEANRADLEAASAENLAAPLLHRLAFGEEKLNQVIRVLDENSTAIAKVMGQKYYDKYNNNDATRRAIKARL